MVNLTDLTDRDPVDLVLRRNVNKPKRLSYEDALDYLPTLRELATSDEISIDADQKTHIGALVKATVRWENASFSSWERALHRPDLHNRTEEELKQDMTEVIQMFAVILVRCFRLAPAWAAGNLELLVDDSSPLYNKRVTSYAGASWSRSGTYGSDSSYMNQEGAVFLKGFAAKSFADADGFEALQQALMDKPGDSELLEKVVDLTVGLNGSKFKVQKEQIGACVEACAQSLVAISDQALVEQREAVSGTLRRLFSMTGSGTEERMSRGAVEAAWRRLIAAGLRSTNLQARRGAADELSVAKKLGFTPADLAPWLREEKIIQELFGDRIDARVLEELSLEPLCEPTVEGLHVLLAELEPLALGHAVIYQKLHGFAIFSSHETQPPAWGRDLVVCEVMKWASGLAQTGSSEAVALIAGFVSYTLRIIGQGDAKHRIFAFIQGKALKEVLEAIVAGLLSPGAAEEQIIMLEAAMDDAHRRHSEAGIRFREGLLKRLVDQVKAASEGGPTPGPATLRLLHRTIQAFPVVLGISEDGPTREEALFAQADGAGSFADTLFEELKAVLVAGSLPAMAIEWRMRILAMVHRGAPGCAMDATRLRALADVAWPYDEGRPFCYFLRYAITTPVSREKDRTLPALDDDALAAVVELLEGWAEESAGLSLAAFFCLQQALVLHNGRSGRITLRDAEGMTVMPDFYAAGCVATADASSGMTGPLPSMVGTWVVVQQDADNNQKVGYLGKFDANREKFDIEYIDDMVHHRKLQVLTRWHIVPSLLEQEPAQLRIKPPHSAAELQSLSGMRALWACALGCPTAGLETPAGSTAPTPRVRVSPVAQLAANVILALHEGPAGTDALLSKLFSELQTTTDSLAIGRILSLLDTLVSQQPLSQKRSHLGSGFSMHVTIVEYGYEEVQGSSSGARIAPRKKVRRQVGSGNVKAHSQTTVQEMHVMAAAVLNRPNVKLQRPTMAMPLDPDGQQTLEELGLYPGATLHAEAFEGDRLVRVHSNVGDVNSVDRLGHGDGECLDRLLQLLQTNHGLSKADRRLCWGLLLRLPTNQRILAEVSQPADSQWGDLLSSKNFWRSAYMILVIDAITSVLRGGDQSLDPDAGAVEMADRWLDSFVEAGGVTALLQFFVAFAGVADGHMPTVTDFEISAVLPTLVRAVGACTLGRSGREAMGGDGGNLLVLAAARVTRWLFDASKLSGESDNAQRESIRRLRRLRLRHAAADGLDLLVESQRRAELPLETIDGLVLPLLLDIAQAVEGHVNSRVAGAIIEVSKRTGAAAILLRKLAVYLPNSVAAAAESSSTPLFDIALVVLQQLKDTIATEAPDARAELTEAVANAVLKARGGVAGLYRLLAALLEVDNAGGGEVSPPPITAAHDLAESLVSCVFPELSHPLEEDATREQASKALLRLLDVCDWNIRYDVLRKVVIYLASVPTPDTFDFEPKAPKEPDTRLDARRNECGYVGLRNRGSTCYMNSTLQQLFWSLPFRNAVLNAPPAVADLPDRPEPLKDDKDDKDSDAGGGGRLSSRNDGPEPTTHDVGWSLQKAFQYMQDCQLGQLNTDNIVSSCRCLRLEYAVTSQNDAAEFFDKICDAVDDACGKDDDKPGEVFATKTCREKHCLNCGLRTRGHEDELRRVQLNTLSPSLEECLEELTAAEVMSGDNRVDCDKCGPKRDTKYQTFFTQLPQVLVLNLARITFDLETLERVKRNPRIEFPMQINMSRFTEDAVVHSKDDIHGCQYELQGVQVHMGGASSGHYYSYAQDVHGKWFKFNDDNVSSFDAVENLEDECFGGQDYNSTSKREKSYNAYMLYYRCVDAAPYRSRQHRSETPAATPLAEGQPTLSLKRSLSVDGRTTDPPHRPVLSRNVTEAFSVGGERLVDKQKRRKQVELRSALVKEIENINSRLHGHAAVFSAPALSLAYSLATSLFAVLGPVETLPENKRTAIPETLCKFVSKVLFDVQLHVRGNNEARLKQWTEALCSQLSGGSPDAARWLLVRFMGSPDPVLGRAPGTWLPKIIFDCRKHGDRFLGVIAVVVASVEACATSGQESDTALCRDFFEAALGLMSSAKGATPLARYGEMWARLTGSEALLPAMAAHRGVHGSPISSLLLHLYLGKGTTPFTSPPAPALPEWGASNQRAYTPLLRAVENLLNSEPGLAAEPVVQSEALWRTFASRNPEVLGHGGSFMRLFPDDFDTHRTVGQTLIESLRPSGAEDQSVSESLRTALTSVLSCGGKERLSNKVALLCVVGQELLANANSTKARGGNYGVGSGASGARNLAGGHKKVSLNLDDLDGIGAGGGGSAPKEIPYSEVGLSGMRDLKDFGSSSGGGLGRVNRDRRMGITPISESDILDLYNSPRSTKTKGVGAGTGSSSGTGRGGWGGPKNPDAVQLLRVLQAVSALNVALPEDWSWARDWLAEVCNARTSRAWAMQGLPIDEAKVLRASLQGPGGQAVEGEEDESPEPEPTSSGETITVSGAGTKAVNGDYVLSYTDEERNPVYEQVKNPTYVLKQQKGAFDEVYWLLAREGAQYSCTLYRTQLVIAEFEGEEPHVTAFEWEKDYGSLPPPVLTMNY